MNAPSSRPIAGWGLESSREGEPATSRRQTMEFLMQSIRGSTFLEEVGESMVPPPVPEQQLPDQGVVEQAPAMRYGLVAEHGAGELAPTMRDGLVAEQGAGELAPADGSADAQILAVADTVAERRESSPPALELSTGKMNPRAPGWNKRYKVICSSFSA
ncbi:uncharacterized protein [Triticum aestivum]|uniref:uncharacterized protein isoform X2 n=1 Tax=Triticum aestivum TaxID=4565 RepID=UPI001D02A75B|nr:uncharacterized protein LOC123160361 isoform X2 [Triticum aestivum]